MTDTKMARVLGFWPAYATAVGLVVAGTTRVSLGYGMGWVGPAFIIPAFVALIISILVAFSYAELSSMIPGCGMISDYTLPSLGRVAAIFAVLAGYIVLVAAAGAMESIIAGFSANEMFPSINPFVFAVGLLIVFLVINLLGVKVFGYVQLFLTIAMMGTASIMGFMGLFQINTISPMLEVPFNPAGWGTVSASVALGIWLYIGIEYVCPMAEEIKEPEKNIPRAMIFGLITIFFADMLFGQAIVRYVPLGTLEFSEVPHLIGAQAMFGRAGLVWMAIVAILASASSIDSHLAAIPRMLYGMAREGMLPKVFEYIHPKYKTPWPAIFLVFVCLFVPILFSINIDVIMTLILTACITWLFSYIIAQVNVIVLRKKYPDWDRPFKTPLYPMPQIVGIISCIYLIVTIHPDPDARFTIYALAAVFSIICLVYAVLWVKYKMKKPLFEPIPIEELSFQCDYVLQKKAKADIPPSIKA